MSADSRAKTLGLRFGRILLGYLLAGFLGRLATAFFQWQNPARSAWDRAAMALGALWILAAVTAHLLRRHAVAVDLWIVFALRWVIPGILLGLFLSAGH